MGFLTRFPVNYCRLMASFIVDDAQQLKGVCPNYLPRSSVKYYKKYT